jgi:hypothetical protein
LGILVAEGRIGRLGGVGGAGAEQQSGDHYGGA